MAEPWRDHIATITPTTINTDATDETMEYCRLRMEEAGGGSTEILISNVKLNGDYEAEW